MIEPVLLDLPATIETARLLMRPPRPGDGAVVFDAVTQSLPELRQFLASLPWVAVEQSLSASEVYCRQAQANFIARKELPFLLFEVGSGLLVGAAGLHHLDWNTPKVEIGYWGRTSTAGRGLIGEAVRALTQMAFAHLKAVRIELLTDADNLPSRRLAERTGFALEGIARCERRAPDGSLRHTCRYAMLSPDLGDAPR